MPVFYLDTSAVLKRYRSEQGTDVVDSIFDERFTPTIVKSVFRGVRSDVLVTSHFTCLEVESVAARMFRGKLLDEKAYNALRPGDSLHAASARYAMTSAQDECVFVCSDKQLLEAVGDDALMPVLNPESPGAMDQLNTYRRRRPIDLP